MSENLLEVKNLSIRFPIRGGIFQRQVGAVQAVTDVSLTLKKGETLGIVGESGCGKTTLGRAIVRLIEPTEGSVLFKGTDISHQSHAQLLPMRRHMQMIFQDPFASLNPRMNVRTIIEEPLLLSGMTDKVARDVRVRELMDIVGLRQEGMNRYPHEFSGGQRQRIGIARAVALNPDLIVADEAVSALDVSIQAQVINLLVDLQKNLGMAYLFIAHDLSVVQYISDRVAVMYLGRIVELASSKTIYHQPMHPYTKALLAAVPATHPSKRKKTQPLAGDVPSPSNPPSGCTFHPRCPFATEICKTTIPALKQHGAAEVACHHVEKIAAGGAL